MANGLLSSDNPYSCRDEIEKWLAWDTAWHKLALEVAMPQSADYAEVLRLHRKYREQDGEPLWKVFVRVGQRLEKAKPDRCKSCLRTHLEYSRLVDVTCADQFHAASPPS